MSDTPHSRDAGLPTPFKRGATPEPRGIIARLFLQSKPDDAQRAIVNRLASDPVEKLMPAEISEILGAFGVAGKAARGVLVEIWRLAVKAFLADNEITGEEARYLGNLRRTLGLTEPELRSVEEDLVHSRFGEAVDVAIGDENLSGADRQKLDALATALRIPKDVADRVLQKKREDLLKVAAHEAIADQRLSPQEMADLYSLARALDIELKIDEATQATLDRYALLWRIENGELPPLNVPISLQRGEVCHAIADAVWMEMRTRTERINYGGPVASIRICKGLRYRVGSVRVQRITRDELTEIDRGRLYLTNKRVIFDGDKKNTTIRLNALLSFSPFSDGVILEKASGKPPHLQLQGDVEVFLAVLGTALAQSD